MLLAIGVLASEAYGYVRDTFREPDAYLVQIKEGQDLGRVHHLRNDETQAEKQAAQ